MGVGIGIGSPKHRVVLYNPRGLLRRTCCKDNIRLPGNYIINATSVAVPFHHPRAYPKNPANIRDYLRRPPPPPIPLP